MFKTIDNEIAEISARLALLQSKRRVMEKALIEKLKVEKYLTRSIEMFKTIDNEIAEISARLALLQSKRRVMEKALIEKVKVEKNERSITLVAGSRRFNVTKNNHSRFTVKEKGRVLIGDYIGGSLDALRLEIAIGAI